MIRDLYIGKLLEERCAMFADELRDRADEVPEVSRASSHVAEIVDHDRGLFVRDDTPLDSLLSNANLRRFGALMAVDADGRLSGVITVEQLGRALKESTTFTGP